MKFYLKQIVVEGASLAEIDGSSFTDPMGVAEVVVNEKSLVDVGEASGAVVREVFLIIVAPSGLEVLKAAKQEDSSPKGDIGSAL